MAASSSWQNWYLQNQNNTCNECHENIFKTGDICMDRVEHYLRYTCEVYSCPICLHILPTTCAIAAHLRFHLKIPPYICPHCGQTLSDTIMSYPFPHSCEGFVTMRANIRFTCNIENCNNFVHPNDFKNHFKTHLIKMYQCTICSLIWSNDAHTRCRHYNNDEVIVSIGFRCPFCPYKLLSESNVEEHVKVHYNDLCKKWNVEIHPCSVCNKIYQDVESLLNHHINNHNAFNIKNIVAKLLDVRNSGNPHIANNIWLIKTCNKCLKSYSYQSTNENRNILKTICPYGCSENNEPQIQCFICNMKISQNWVNIKIHYAQFHKEYKCLDLKLKLTKIDIKYTRKPNIQHVTGNIQNNLEETHTTQVNNESAQTEGNLAVFKNETQVNNYDDLTIAEINVSSEENDELAQTTHNSNVCGMEIDTKGNTDDIEDDDESMQISENSNLTKMEIDANVNSDVHDDNDLSEEDRICIQDNNESVQAAENLNEELELAEVTVAERNVSLQLNSDEEQREENLNKCKICNCVCDDKESLETHFITHRDPDMPYQCLECGDCFAARGSLAIHLLITHGINRAQEYINSKPCYNREHVSENQCKVCRLQFESSIDFARHFRGHGLAFVMSIQKH